ncbi:N-acetylmuramoyl-L-alanine amidase family protein [Clostridium beijerinckii]|uniref:sunset domain-containing protein n=1 Tax=Clostridium beijerinckii TaxID=1520 RepID=UPI0022279892|nr:N-acetylmuramoyl-L-alanine amidase family protein [Clostridium beijerinckii]UYZ34965.1 N-acetylmuramoyl-L-alanine amidase family protein [Clostridium beijerinckii]
MTILLFLACLVCLIAGLIKPSKLIFWKEPEQRTRKNVLKYFGLATIISFALVGIFNPSNQTNTNVASAKKETVKNTEIQEKQETKEVKETKKSGWMQENGNWYLYGDDGSPKTGWIKDNNKSYYFNSSGILQTGWIKDGGKDYYLDKSGVMQTGWKESNGKWYYLNSDGSMASNTTVDGYYLSSSGAMEDKSSNVDSSSSSVSSNSSNSNSGTVKSSSSGGNQYVDANGNGLIKGSKNHIYHVPGSTYYSRTKNVEQWFKTVEEAEAAGYRAPEK